MLTTSMQCPRCHVSLVGLDYEGVHIDTCSSCGGDWLDAGELAAIVKARKTRFDQQQCLEMARAEKITCVKLRTLDRQLTCPSCGGTTHPINYGEDTGLIIDKCSQCGGVWIDKGELDKIQELVQGWESELPEDLAHYSSKMREVRDQVNQDLYVHLSHFRLINSAINGVFDLFGE